MAANTRTVIAPPQMNPTDVARNVRFSPDLPCDVLSGRGGLLERELAHGSKIDFTSAERRDRFDEVQIFPLGKPQARQFCLAEAFPQRACREIGIGVEGNETFALGWISH